MKKYCLVVDDSGHDYVIPAERKFEWYRLLDLPEEEFDLPNWAKMVGGGLEFESPTENDKLLFQKVISIDMDQFVDSGSGNLILDTANQYNTLAEKEAFLIQNDIIYKIIEV